MDTYTKTTLTIIAAALVTLCVQNLAGTAQAYGGPQASDRFQYVVICPASAVVNGEIETSRCGLPVQVKTVK